MNALAHYQALPYTRRVEGFLDEDGTFYWIAWIEEMPDCEAEGDTQGEALCNLNGIFDDYIEAMIEFEEIIPLPQKYKSLEAARETEPIKASDEIIMEDPDAIIAYGALATKALSVYHSPKGKNVHTEELSESPSTMLPPESFKGHVPMEKAAAG